MESFHEYIDEYRQQMEKGTLQKAYRGLMEYIMALRTHLIIRYPDFISGSFYYGYMDMTYFPFTPKSLKDRSLKIAIVFIHETCGFEAWLAGSNRQTQAKYWKLFTDSGWDKYRIIPPAKGVDSILETTLADHPDFSDLDSLTGQIEAAVLNFIWEIEGILSGYPYPI